VKRAIGGAVVLCVAAVVATAVVVRLGHRDAAADVTSAKRAAPELVHRSMMAMTLPASLDARRAVVDDPVRAAERRTQLSSAFVPEVVDEQVADIEGALREVAGDATYRAYTDHRITVDRWRGERATSTDAFLRFDGHESFYDDAGGWSDTDVRGYEVTLRRVGRAWRMVSKDVELYQAP
jgi:hypothetical protein